MAVDHSDRLYVTVDLKDQAATMALGAALAGVARASDVFGLSGDLGAGKTVLARGFINALAKATGAPDEDVPSPTYTLLQHYEFPGVTVCHADLYRVESETELRELGLTDMFYDCVSLIEWPDRLGRLMPPEALLVRLEIGSNKTARRAVLEGPAGWRGRFKGVIKGV